VILDDSIVFIWFGLAAISVAYVAWDCFVKRNPEMTVMKWGWVLITLYMGPVALALYVLSDKEPRPGEHEEFIKPLWKQGVGSTVHCVAGDATGIITAAAIVAALGLPMTLDLAIEYAAGFAFGLFIFQALFMKNMAGGKYLTALRRSFIPEWLSMNTMAAGMFFVMTQLMMGRDMRAMDPAQPQFWFVMSMGVIVGFATAYPVNVWMVAQGLKHGLMTQRSAGSRGSKGTTHRSEHSGHEIRSEMTRPQLTVVTIITILALVTGVVIPANMVNLSLSAEDVRGVIMPPGMIMASDTRGDAMREMGAVDPDLIRSRAPLSAQGDRLLEAEIVDGVKVFRLETSVIEWTILDGQPMAAYAFNRQVPGPRIEVTEGDRLRLEVKNDLPESTAVHWHGLILPNEMDGAAEITQPPIEPGDTYVYEFTARQPGMFFYHTHDEPDRQQALGLYGALLVEPKDGPSYDVDKELVIQLQEWLEREGYTYPAMPMEGAMPNFFTINGKSYPDTPSVRMKVGEKLLVRFIGTHNSFIHPMHIHGGPFEIVQTDGYPVPRAARLTKDTVNVGPGERYDVIWKARRPGKWLLHCHIAHHMTNDNVEQEGGGGLMMIIDVSADAA
jgi:FtsP/CotA-like multicopper oxidase with cupredoxin domain